jgi:molecular chaperone DnaK (HSP70)
MNVLDRKKAADLLKVSIRTLDRYIRKGILPKHEIGGRIVIKFKDLKPLLDQKRVEHDYLSSLNSNFSRPDLQEQGTAKEENSATEEENQIEALPQQQSNEDTQIYKQLYEQVQEELKAKQERLEGANYRVGQLEGLLKESVPLIEYRKSIAAEQEKRQELEELLNNFEKDNDTLNQTVESKRQELEQISRKLEQEKFNKKVFLIILIILFLLQPLWLLFPPVLT